MVPENLLFWIAPMAGTPHDDQNVLCRRHADAMSVPRGWTLDDRREEIPRLFMPRDPRGSAHPASRRARAGRARRTPPSESVEQLVIDGTGEIERPGLPPAVPASGPVAPPEHSASPDAVATTDTVTTETGADSADSPWRPSFDHDNDLEGLLAVSSPLLSRAFRGTDRPRG